MHVCALPHYFYSGITMVTTRVLVLTDMRELPLLYIESRPHVKTSVVSGPYAKRYFRLVCLFFFFFLRNNTSM